MIIQIEIPDGLQASALSAYAEKVGTTPGILLGQIIFSQLRGGFEQAQRRFAQGEVREAQLAFIKAAPEERITARAALDSARAALSEMGKPKIDQEPALEVIVSP